MTTTEKLKEELDTLKRTEESIKATGYPNRMKDLLALLDRINIELINVTGKPVTFVDKSGNVIATYKPKKVESTQFKLRGCSFLVTQETFQAFQSVIPLIKILGPTPSLLLAVPKEPYYETTNNPFTPNKLIGYKRVEFHNIDFKK